MSNAIFNFHSPLYGTVLENASKLDENYEIAMQAAKGTHRYARPYGHRRLA